MHIKNAVLGTAFSFVLRKKIYAILKITTSASRKLPLPRLLTNVRVVPGSKTFII